VKNNRIAKTIGILRKVATPDQSNRVGLGQPSQINRIFQIEVGALRATSMLPPECSLAGQEL
jgi:hypothetical protein